MGGFLPDITLLEQLGGLLLAVLLTLLGAGLVVRAAVVDGACLFRRLLDLGLVVGLLVTGALAIELFVGHSTPAQAARSRSTTRAVTGVARPTKRATNELAGWR